MTIQRRGGFFRGLEGCRIGRVLAVAAVAGGLSLVGPTGPIQAVPAQAAPAPAAPAATTPAAEPQVVNFTCLGVPQSFSVPPGVTSIHVKAVGAAGGAPVDPIRSSPAGAPPGLGGVVEVDLPVTQGLVYNVTVGCRTGYGYAKGGAGGTNSTNRHGATGGGASAVQGNFAVTPSIVGGGGGGGGGNSSLPTFKGGVGGSAGQVAQNGADGQPVGYVGGQGGAGGSSVLGATGTDGGSNNAFP